MLMENLAPILSWSVKFLDAIKYGCQESTQKNDNSVKHYISQQTISWVNRYAMSVDDRYIVVSSANKIGFVWFRQLGRSFV